MTPEALTTFFGWLTLLNIAVLGLSTLALLLFGNAIARMHAAMFGLEIDWIKQSYFAYLAGYKILTLVTSLLPYLALRLM